LSEMHLASQGSIDIRKAIKQKKQKLQMGFYETLRQAQVQSETAPHTIGSFSMSKPGTADFNNPGRPMDTIGEHRTKLIMGAGHALSMKTNNLKYHLMRDLL